MTLIMILYCKGKRIQENPSRCTQQAPFSVPPALNLLLNHASVPSRLEPSTELYSSAFPP